MSFSRFFRLTALGKRFLLPTMMFMVASLVILSLILSRQYSSTFSEMMESRGNSTISFLSESSTNNYLSFDFDSLERLVLNIIKDEEVAYAAFFDDKDKLLTSASPKIKDFSNLLLFQKQIKQEGTLLGTVKIAYRKDILKASEKKSLVTVTLTTILALLFLGITIALITRKISEQLNQIILPLGQMGSDLTQASLQLSSASNSLSDGVNNSAASLEETVSSIEELSSMVTLAEESANKVSQHSEVSQQAALRGQDEIDNLIQAMQGISKSSTQVVEIISVIENIAFQTNLLALNAAVEAARAGDEGRGFAVVAEAVRNLAQKSTTAAKEITTLIKTSSNDVITGADMADNSAIVLKEIVASSQEVAQLNNSVAAATKEQSSGFTQIGQALNQIDRNTQNTAALAEETSSSASEVSNQAKRLDDLVARLILVVVGRKKR
ncbi:MAG: methyl-accepting chemotaxis protein [Bdellovibrionales bacterium]|nr:methyl-accepting chemotaxis protein [Bdellovibrionales bacterium]MBT3524912.1 methyl-accepting chemotaxis protein [Bdellovibrionales bacterium]MBT7670394.1 methyl-accepting chemotaxis protein [Bdellovibrionales bacterium]MBT7766118.1 methyl-accepting chemotaxis protein [Bdellovibrionales bacterium]